MNQVRVLLTGGAGFVGHHMVRKIITKTNWEVIIIDRLNCASYGLQRLKEINALNNKRVTIFTVDFSQRLSVSIIKEIGEVNYILHFGAETSVEESILYPKKYVKSNVLGTFWMLEFARTQKYLKYFIYLSTNEVFGPANDENSSFKAWDRYNSTNPYSATKAAGEELALSYANTFNIPTLIIHSMNLFGERQHYKKFIPTIVRYVLKEKTLPIYSDPQKKIAGSRFYLYCAFFADAILYLLDKAEEKLNSKRYNWNREKFNIVGEHKINNLELAQMIANYLGKKLLYEMVDFHSSRPGHDLRYSLDGSDMIDLGWRPPKLFKNSLEKTVKWLFDHQNWIYE
jgi:dTDP-glucose 4,6-dehydratase